MFNFSSYEWGSLIYSTILLSFLLGGYIFRVNIKKSRILKQISIWLVIIFLLTTLYNFKESILTFFIPYKAKVDQKSIEISKALDEHFYIMLEINDKKILFLIDTGATHTTLSLKDAKRIGIDVTKLKFNRPYNTANGIVYVASTKLEKVSLNGIIFENVFVSVNRGELNTSLLGMNFLNRFKGYSIIEDKLILYY